MVNLEQASQSAHYAYLMDHFRKLKKPEVGSYAIKEIWDYQRKKATNWVSKKQLKLENEPFNLMKVVFVEGINLMMVPTEQKMYLHLSLSGKMMHKDQYSSMSRDFDQKLIKLLELVNQQ
ncbi:hypothetical protein [Cesiribacter andamanensis]|uniref:Uncharacterized protein n=1 Tax=Cesiribacter andamanensis AMV16 TaxID=1279009 RepID=M7N3U2_9BACT|nr:hypothetical protein [Cesiribacter andamanensis]EMR01962.1 hypothetical protein ADICEAN_02897 [Cesiribacter andamanensis AMV16]